MAAFLYRLEAPKNYKAPKKSPFKDVPTNHKFYKEIAWVYTSGLSTGIKTPGGRTYAPKASVTREAMAAFIYRLEGAKYSGAKKSPFADMKPGQKFYKEITWMYSSGLSTGINKNGKRIYSPKGKVTREAMAAFIYRLKH
nr:S-layer homology domain-containing protein [Leucobacter chromiireducens]